MSGLSVKHRCRDRLVLERSRLREFFALVFTAGFVCFWYFMLGVLGDGAASDLVAARDWMWWLGVLAPLVLVPRVLRALRVVLFGERWEFVAGTRKLRRNGRVVLDFADAQSVEVERSEGETTDEASTSDSYRLIICLKNTKTTVLDRSTDHLQILAVSQDVAEILGVPVFHRRA